MREPAEDRLCSAVELIPTQARSRLEWATRKQNKRVGQECPTHTKKTKLAGQGARATHDSRYSFPSSSFASGSAAPACACCWASASSIAFLVSSAFLARVSARF